VNSEDTVFGLNLLNRVVAIIEWREGTVLLFAYLVYITTLSIL
jgi:hypothetical protein